MRRAVTVFICIIACLSFRQVPARGSLPAAADNPAAECRLAIHAAERTHAIPENLLAAIGTVESGRRDAITGQLAPWPWTLNAEGQGHAYDTRQEAVAAVENLRKAGVRSIDVGCLQVNLMYHPDAFDSLDQAFDPNANADYAARLLAGLFAQTQAWPKAVGLYHSATVELAEAYQAKVLAVWSQQTAAPVPILSSMPLGGAAFGRTLAFVPPSRALAHPLAGLASGGEPAGRDLAAYRAAPIPLVSRPRAAPR